MKRVIYGLFLVLLMATVALCARDAFDTLSDFISLADSMKGGSSGGGGGGRSSGSSSGGRSSGGGRSSTSGRSSGSTGGRSSTSGRVSGPGRSPTGPSRSNQGTRVSGPGRSPTGPTRSPGRISGPGRSPTGPTRSIGRVSGPGRAPTSVSIQRNNIQNRINSAFAGLSKVSANPALSAALSRYAASLRTPTASLKAPSLTSSLFSKTPLGPTSTFSKVAPTLPTNKFTKPATVAPAVALPARVPIPQPRPANLGVTTAPIGKNPITPTGAQRVAHSKELTGPQVARQAVKQLGTNLAADPKARMAQIADQMANPKSLSKCAGYVAAAIEAGTGIALSRPASTSAKDYGTTVTKAGMKQVTTAGPPQVGDVRVISSVPGHIHGHMEMYTGPKSGWVSDFAQGVSAVENPKSSYYGADSKTYRF